jgi:putative ABC transport system permease protein
MRIVMTSIVAFMRFLYQSIFLALGQIWANKMRSFLTMLGIIIAVASVTAVVAAISGMKAKILSEVKSTFGTNLIFIWPTRPNTGPMKNAGWWDLRMRPEQFDNLLTHCPSVSRFGMQTGLGRQTVTRREKSVEGVGVTCAEPACHLIQGKTVTLGRLISEMDEMQARQVCLIDPKLRDKLELDKDCIGQSILVGYNTFIVVGLLEARPSSMFSGGDGENIEMFIPFRTGLKLNRDPWIDARAESRTSEASEDALAELRFFFRRTRHISPGEPDTFNLLSMENELRGFNRVALYLRLAGGGIAGISLLVGGIGIMNIMLVSVSERTREIGLRKAVGARRSAILTQFLIEAMVICMVGGLIGLGLGQLLTKAIASMAKFVDMAYIPWQVTVLAIAFSCTVGICFGMFPAIKAARLDPIEALRHE